MFYIVLESYGNKCRIYFEHLLPHKTSRFAVSALTVALVSHPPQKYSQPTCEYCCC